MKHAFSNIVAIIISVALTIPTIAGQQAGEMTLDPDEASKRFQSRGYSLYADRGFPTWPLWGNTHLHISNSPDAFAFGNRLGPEGPIDSRGESQSPRPRTSDFNFPDLSDFLVVTDHGVAVGAMMELYMIKESPKKGVQAAGELIAAGSQGNIPLAILDPKIARTVWNTYTETAVTH